MARWVCINGEVVPGEEARISVFDRGFLHGDAVYEVMPAPGGRPLFWDDHVARLWASAARLALPVELDAEALRAEVAAVCARVGGDVYVRVIITRGEGLRLDPADAGHANRVIIGQPLAPDPAVAAGYALHTVHLARASLDAKAKSSNKLPVVLAVAEAKRRGADEVLRVDDQGFVLEGGTSTFFAVFGGAVHTPPLEADILDGITRRKVLQVARATDTPVVEAPIPHADLAAASEMFVTSSTRGVVPVRRLDHRALPAPGLVTARLQAAYAALVATQ